MLSVLIKTIGFIFVISLFMNCSTRKLVRERWPNYSPKVIEVHDKKSPRRVETYYFLNGNVETEISYFGNKLDGLSRYWNIKGLLISESNYLNGLPHGFWIYYQQNGNLLKVEEYQFGQKHGYERYYHENGILKSEIKYVNGKIFSQIIRWDSNGNILQ
jgi:antitoxin component YwqK of YwqJK toxin-antitoxin module